MSIIQEFKNNINSALFFGSSVNLGNQLQVLQNRLDNYESGHVIDKINPKSKAKLEEIKVIESSKTKYEFKINNKPKFTYEDIADKGIVFYDGTLSNLLNELKHAFQFETGKIDFIKVNGEPENIPGVLYDLGDEVETYKRQYAYDGILKLRVVMTEEEMLNQFKKGKIKNGLGLGTLEIKKMKKITADIIVKVEDSLGSGSLYNSISKRSLDIHSSLGDIRKGNRYRGNFITGLGIDKQDKKKPYIDFVKIFIETNPFIYVKY